MRPQYTSVFLVSLALGVHAQTLEVTPTGVAYGSAGTRTEGKTDAGQGGGRSGFYETANPSPAANWYPGASNWQHLIEARHSNLANNYALQIAGSFWGQELYFRKTADSPAQGWSKFVVENPAGNVGIGTSTPSAKLDVIGDLKAGTVNGEKPPLKFVINPNKETSKYHSILIPGSLVKQYLADGDGGTWKYIFHVISDNTVRIYKEFSYINPEPMPGTTNYYGYSILDNGQERAFILGNGTSYELSSSPWAWVWVRNFKSSSQENNFTQSSPWKNGSSRFAVGEGLKSS